MTRLSPSGGGGVPAWKALQGTHIRPIRPPYPTWGGGRHKAKSGHLAFGQGTSVPKLPEAHKGPFLDIFTARQTLLACPGTPRPSSPQVGQIQPGRCPVFCALWQMGGILIPACSATERFAPLPPPPQGPSDHPRPREGAGRL